MKFSAPHADLLVAAELAGQAIDKAGAFLVTTSNVGIDVTAVGLKRVASTAVRCSVAEPGHAFVDGKGFVERVRNMPGDRETVVSVVKSNVAITAPKSQRRYTMRTLPDGVCHPFPQVPNEARRVYLAADLRDGIRVAKHAASTDTTRPHLSSIVLELDGDPGVVATDGHRLVRYAKEPIRSLPERLLFDGASADFLCRMLDGVDEGVELMTTRAWTLLRHDGTIVGVPAVEAQAPPYEKVIPNYEHEAGFGFVPKDMVEALRVCEVASNLVRVTIGSVAAPVLLEARSPDGEESREELRAQDVRGSGTFTCMGRYLRELAVALPSEKAELRMRGEWDPVLVLGGRMLGLMMPVRP